MQTNRPSHAKAMSDLIKSRLLSEDIPPRQRQALLRNLARYENQLRTTLQPARPQPIGAYGPPTGQPGTQGGLGGGNSGSGAYGPEAGGPVPGNVGPGMGGAPQRPTRYTPGAAPMAPNLLGQVRSAQQSYASGPGQPRREAYESASRRGQAYGLQNRMEQIGIPPDQQQEMASLSDDSEVQEVVDMPEWASRMQEPGFQSEVRSARIKAVKKMIRELVASGDAPPEAAYLSDAALGMYFSDPDILDDLFKRSQKKKKDAR